MNYQIKTICSYCKIFMCYKSGGKSPGLVSHGICDVCFKIEMDKLKELKRGKNGRNERCAYGKG